MRKQKTTKTKRRKWKNPFTKLYFFTVLGQTARGIEPYTPEQFVNYLLDQPLRTHLKGLMENAHILSDRQLDYAIYKTVETHHLTRIENIQDMRGFIVTLFNGDCDVHKGYCQSPFKIHDATDMLEQFYDNDFNNALKLYPIKNIV